MTTGEEEPQRLPALLQIIQHDAVGQLRRCDGQMARLGSEDGIAKLDWVEGVARLLEHDNGLEEVEAEARQIWESGIRHVIWAGMGGSIITVRVLADLRFCDAQGGKHVALYPLDSTDPAALNEIVREIAQAKNVALSTDTKPEDPAFLRTLLSDVMMIGVSMGMTSEEPITHLAWFAEMLEQAQLQAAHHLLVMTLPGSYLDDFARQHNVRSRPLQLDGRSGTGGRMSAPTTQVFLLPAALYLTRLSSEGGQLRTVLQHAWQEYNLALAANRPAEHPFVQLATALSAASVAGACRLLLTMPQGWQALVPWIEQLMEESLGKDGKGVVVFDEQPLNSSAPGYDKSGTLHVQVTTSSAALAAEPGAYTLHQPSLASTEPRDRLAATAASFLGWQLSMALYGYLHDITFAGQPAVENYKARARTLRVQHDPLQVALHWQASVTEGILTLLAPHNTALQTTIASIFAQTLQHSVSKLHAQGGLQQRIPLRYLDLTFNGTSPASLWSMLETRVMTLGNQLLGVPVKLRQAPAAYHSTEQSEMDGPPYLVSLRILMRTHEESIIGTYSDTFLCAQALSTWQAMIEQGRPCFLLLVDGNIEEGIEALDRFFQDVSELQTSALVSKPPVGADR